MDEKTIETYNVMAKEYDDETIDFWERFPQTFLDAFAEHAQGKVLDIGSGPGRDGLLLKERGIDITCLDASQAMIECCKEKGLQAIRADFNALPCSNNSFDGVWAYMSLLHIPKSDITKALDEIRRVLKDEGIFGLGLIEGETESYRESPNMHLPRWFSYYTKEEITSFLKNNGFSIVYFEQFKPGSKTYLNFIAKKTSS